MDRPTNEPCIIAHHKQVTLTYFTGQNRPPKTWTRIGIFKPAEPYRPWDACLLRVLLLRRGRDAEYCDQPVCLSVCLSASISLESLDRSVRNLVCRSPVAVARSSSGGVALRYVLPVLWMTSRLAVMDATLARVDSSQRRRSITRATDQSQILEARRSRLL